MKEKKNPYLFLYSSVLYELGFPPDPLWTGKKIECPIFIVSSVVEVQKRLI